MPKIKTSKKQPIIYFTQSCPFCHKLKEFLKAHNIKFKELDVGKDQKAAQEMVKKSGQMGVPVTDISGQIIIGFDKPKLEKALGL